MGSFYDIDKVFDKLWERIDKDRKPNCEMANQKEHHHKNCLGNWPGYLKLESLKICMILIRGPFVVNAEEVTRSVLNFRLFRLH